MRGSMTRIKCAALLLSIICLTGMQPCRSLLAAPIQGSAPSIGGIIAQYPIQKGTTWTYKTSDIVRKDYQNCHAQGRAVVTIVNVQDGLRARVAKAEVDTSVTDVGGDRGCESSFVDSNLGWMYVVVWGGVHESPVFGDEMINRALSEGATPFEERHLAPDYFFPLQSGVNWGDKYYQHAVLSDGPVQTSAGAFRNCFKIVRTETDDPELEIVEQQFCSGVGIVREKIVKRGHTSERELISYTIGNSN